MTSARRWWKQNEPFWRQNPAYYENLEQKAGLHGKEWVRENKRMLDMYWDYYVISRNWADAPLPEGREKHTAWVLDRLDAIRQRGGHVASRGYTLQQIDLFGYSLLLTNDEFERRLAAGEPIPLDPEE